MATWIFQGNPDRFDIDGYLLADVPTITWVVRQRRSEIAVGDTVFIWRSKGSAKGNWGVVAECRVVSPVTLKAGDEASKPYRKTEFEAPEHRVDLLVLRVASKREMLLAKWLEEDPVLRTLSIFKMRQGTNFAVGLEESQRLRELWNRTGVDWTWKESVAGLWAFEVTRGKPVSRLPGAPVALVAMAIGRAVGGVYNKVMNFRSLDPTDPRIGLDGFSDVDERVWERFFDSEASAVNGITLRTELDRLGLKFSEAARVEVAAPNVELTNTAPLETLLKRYLAALESGAFPPLPRTVLTTTETIVRNPIVRDIAKVRAGYKCEIPGCQTTSFLTDEGVAFCEAHHVVPLAEGGSDKIENAICLCPIHHREAHHGRERRTLRQVMLDLRQANA